MTHLLLTSSVITAGTIELAVPLVLAVELSGADWTPGAVGVAAATVLGAAAAGTVLVINALSSMNKKADKIIDTTTKTHEAANSTLTAANTARELLLVKFQGMEEAKNKEIDGLKQQIAIMDAARVAAAAVTTPPTMPSAQVDSIQETVEDTNTIVKKQT